LFQPVKGILFRFSPLPGGGFPGEIIERASEAGVIANEPTIETCETKECTDVFEFSGGRPICDTPQLDGVHSKLTSLKMDAKVLNLILLELAFLRFEKELI